VNTDELFQAYQPTPRAPELGQSVFASAKTGLHWVIGVFVGSFVLGIPLSFVRFRRSAAWDPLHIVYGGLAIAIFALPIALVAYFTLSAYVKIFRTGRLVEGVVVDVRGHGSVVQSAVGVGPDLSFVPGLRATPGQRVPMLVGDAMSSKALCIVGRGELRRCSLLTSQQLQQVMGAPTHPR